MPPMPLKMRLPLPPAITFRLAAAAMMLRLSRRYVVFAARHALRLR